MTQRKVNEKMDSHQKNAIPGVAQLGKDQYHGTYKWSKDVAGHDGKKQTAPKSSNTGGFGDKPVVGGYTNVERSMSKKAAGGAVKQITGAGSKEHPSTHTKSPVRKFKESTLYEFGDADPNAQPAQAPTPEPQAETPAPAPAPTSSVDANTLLDKLPEIVAHVKERQTLDPDYNKMAAASDVAEMLGVDAKDPTIAKILKFLTVQFKLRESFRPQVRGSERAKKISPVLDKGPKKHPYNHRLVGEDDAEDLGAEGRSLPAEEDTVTLDVPLLIRVMEYAKEDAKTDMELHKAVERMLSIGGPLTMDNYDSIVSNLDEDAVVESRKQRIRKATQMKESLKAVRQEFEESKKLDEVSKETLKNYKRTSAGDAINRQNAANRSGEKDTKIAKRNAGQERAEQKLQAKEQDVKESFAQFKAGKL